MQKILVIDDEKSLLDIFQQILSKSGCNVEMASDVKEGIKKFDDGLFDLVITDILMQGGNGNDIVRHIRSSDRQVTPVIGISGTPWLLNDSDFDMVFIKPFPLEALVNAVHDLSSTSSK
jgi:DNA-binding response OmpR family regulator